MRCVCGHLKNMHTGGEYECNELWCDCEEFIDVDSTD